MEFKHIPVMLNEVINGLNIKENGIYVDATIGGAGHSIEIVRKLKSGILIGIDQDINAINRSSTILEEYKEKVILVHRNYSEIKSVLAGLGFTKVDGILLDLGVSSHQLDTAQRGFSYNLDAPLDMRMDTSRDFSARNVVNQYSLEELTNIFYKYGEEKWAKRIAEFIVQERKVKPIETTFELVSVIKKAIPKKVRQTGHHPAKKVFQAIRIEVNNELEVLENTIEDMVDVLNIGGRLAIITFHSLEDRLVKDKFRELNTSCICPKELPVCVCNHVKKIEIITKKPIQPTSDEINENPRSHSAKLRIAERI
ncbi:16S rRNA (cytosine(1402)-N(4))-methyltransferase RsmH [Soehngenia longivitae]|uniref:Ribosomal RNA small subunit methyltransferase H n=1 Tax=Soehngenia longivitae TaxID=2562294 RepID=A0A4Z0D5I5_9FIRM|nr:16S rRNA (cytosine(1402)-N(4))-methyltransferase RsmH [Soehngenia longivitae]TFZ40089.1 16S rRNA (cytosine(1402)-N(4))-methyltransferase RsmH [Soehngenia longivitae]